VRRLLDGEFNVDERCGYSSLRAMPGAGVAVMA